MIIAAVCPVTFGSRVKLYHLREPMTPCHEHNDSDLHRVDEETEPQRVRSLTQGHRGPGLVPPELTQSSVSLLLQHRLSL